jgi:4-amino-4-deoxy-L-arabinose transferase-like glycosyltransferase
MSDKALSLNRNLPFYFITAALVIGLIIPVLIQDGMFIDGVLYTSVSKNLANGIGSFWFPKFDQIGVGGSENFHEHPPLVFGIQSIFFKIFGNSIYTERIYSFFTACFTAFLIVKIWQLSVKNDDKKLYWLAIFLWIITPIVFWSFSNNVQENTMGIFTLLAVIFALSAMFFKKRIFLKLTIAGVFIFLAAFSKGVPGLFPLVTIVLYAVVFQDITIKKIILYSLILLIIPAFIFAAFLVFIPEAKESLTFYFFERLIGRINQNPTVDNRFHILYNLLLELLPALILSGIVLLISKLRKINTENTKTYKKKSLLFLLIGLSGSAPLILTSVQRPFYFSHAIPFFAISFALFISPSVSQAIKRINPYGIKYKVLLIASILVLITAITVSALQYGKASRHKDMLSDVYTLGKIIPEHSVIGISQSLVNNWSLKCYFVRHFNITLSQQQKHFQYYLTKKDTETLQKENYKKVSVDTKEYNLYKSIE